VLHVVFVGLLVALLALQVVKRFDGLSTLAVFVIAIALAAAAAALYARADGVRSVLTVLSPAPLLFLLLFLFASPVSDLALGSGTKAFAAEGSFRPPIVIVTFDAFAEHHLMDDQRRIDATRYPNFARLAGDATWYRNAESVHENTTYAVPAILDGKWPNKDHKPIVRHHPNNVFTLLGNSYAIRASEEATNLCPSSICSRVNRMNYRGRIKLLAEDTSVVFAHVLLPDGMRKRVPSISDNWKNFRRGDKANFKATRKQSRREGKILAKLFNGGRPGRMLEAIRRIRPERRPTLDFMHVMLPHEPLEYLPSGRTYRGQGDPSPGTDANESYDDEQLTHQSYQRHLLQMGFTDRMMGQLIGRLKRTGMYDRALIVVTADHGISFDVKDTPAPPFQVGKLGFRRDLTRENADDVMDIPLFVKYPEQEKGEISDEYVRSIDILPTIADVLKLKLPFKVDGRSLRAPRSAPSDIEYMKTSGRRIKVPVAALERGRAATLRRQVELFGTGRDSLFRIGPSRELLGQNVAEVPRGAGDGARVRIYKPERFGAVELRSSFVPAQVIGQVTGGRADGRTLAYALNGVIVATGPSFGDVGRQGVNFSGMLPEDAFRDGRNTLEIFQVLPGGQLAPMGRAPS
jgi:hypothetical protein